MLFKEANYVTFVSKYGTAPLLANKCIARARTVVKQAGALHLSVVVRHLNHMKYHLNYSPMYIDSFSAILIQNWINPIMQRVKYDISMRSATC